jgi:hypothetical protein
VRIVARITLAVALASAAMLASSAPAGDFEDAPCPAAAPGEDLYICPTGVVGTPYSHTFELKGDEDLECANFAVSSGTFPPGLTLSSEGEVSGSPTEAGTFVFYVTVSYSPCVKPASDRRFQIEIEPAEPKLTIGPEVAPVGTVGAPYSLAMTATLTDPTTWSIAAGAPPAGLAIDPVSGVISGTPTTAGSFPFTVQAVIDAERTDTKSLTIDIRAQLAITASPRPFNAATRMARTEVGLFLSATLSASGGHAPYTWTQTGTLPPGIAFDLTDGSLTGEAEEMGTYRFTVSVADSEGRSAAYAGTIVVAKRLSIVTRRLKNGKVGRAYRSKLVSRGGVAPRTWRIKKGPLPRGIRFERTTGTFVGIPAKAGTWLISVEIVDALKAKASSSVTIVVSRGGNKGAVDAP